MSDFTTEQTPEQNQPNQNMVAPAIKKPDEVNKNKIPYLPITLIFISIIILTLAILKFQHEGTFFGKKIVEKKDTVEVTPYDDMNMDSSVMTMPVDSINIDSVVQEEAKIVAKKIEPIVEKKQLIEAQKTTVTVEKKQLPTVKKTAPEPTKPVDVIVKENQNLPATFEAYLVTMANPTVNYDTRFESGDKYAPSYFNGNASAIQVDENGNTISSMGVDEFLGVLRVNEFKIKIKDKSMQNGKVSMIKFMYQF